MDFSTPYLTKQIIAYIGNKRRLLELIYKAIDECIPGDKSGIKFFDVFAGSGVVSRLAKQLNCEVYSNDWEYYSFIINKAFIGINHSEIRNIFGSLKNFQDVIANLNSLPNPDFDSQYIAKFYAPASCDIDKADFRTERLFYTRNNALIIDKIRNYLEQNYSKNAKEKSILLALLLYESATHTNTSGVFKAFHKGFGGHSRDALKRIVSPVRIHLPILIDSDYPVHIYQKDSNTLSKQLNEIEMDITYLDPPYKQHEYGSNYHMLNTIALWDKIPAPKVLNEKGILKEKAAIRKDWVKTKSDYCSAEPAIQAFTELIKTLNTKFILISYSTDGLIPFDEMVKICSIKGNIKIVTNEYIKYRGGKQSNTRLNTNIEFILIIETEQQANPDDLKKLYSVIEREKLLLLFKQRFSREKLSRYFELFDNKLILKYKNREIVIPTDEYFILYPPSNFEKINNKKLLNLLQKSVCISKEEELQEIISKINGNSEVSMRYLKMLPHTLRKLAHKKYKEEFFYWLKQINLIEVSHPELFQVIKSKIYETESLAIKRFEN